MRSENIMIAYNEERLNANEYRIFVQNGSGLTIP